MKRFITMILSFVILISNFAVVYATGEALLSKNKTVECGILGTGTLASDMTGHGEAGVMVDSVTSKSDKTKMWFLHSTVTTDTVYLNVDLEDDYIITKIKWIGRYDSTVAQDFSNMKIYGANKADYSDKKLIFTTGNNSEYTSREGDFIIADEDISDYRYIRFERIRRIGGSELYIYGYKKASSNANLSFLEVERYSFTSSFSADKNEYTILTDAFPENNRIKVNAAAQSETAAVEGVGEYTVDCYGTTSVPVSVTSEDGTKKTYTVNFVVSAFEDISSKVTAFGSNVYSGSGSSNVVLNDSYCTSLFTGSASRFKVYIKYTDRGYIQADLGKAYKLTKFKYTKTNLEVGKNLTVTASNDPGFKNKVTIGNIADAAKTQTEASCLLDAVNAYRYIRIEKNNITHDFLPTSMRIYAMPEISAVGASSYEEGYNAQNVFDSDISTYWQSKSETSSVEKKYSEKYFQVDLGEEKKISAVELSARADSDDSERTDFEIRLSNSPVFSNYVKVPCVITNEIYPNRLRVGKMYNKGEIYRKEIDLPDKYRYIRYVKLFNTKSGADPDLTGIATLSRFNVETSEDIYEEQENNNPDDFETVASFTDEAGDKSNIFVRNSNIIFKGSVKNNTNSDKNIHCITAAYASDGRLSCVKAEKKTALKNAETDFSSGINVGSDIVRVSGFIFEEESLRPLCKVYNTVNYYVENPSEVFVSQANGDDIEGDGTILKPFKTIEAAHIKAGMLNVDSPVSVCIKNGEYYISQTVNLKVNGKSSSYPITYKGIGNDETLISGGMKITDFTYEGNGVYSASADLEYISDLYVNDKRRSVASSEIIVPVSEVYDTSDKVYGPVVDKEFLPDGLVYTEGMEIFYPTIKWRSYTYKLNNITSNGNTYTLAIVPNIAVENRAEYNSKDLPTDFDKSGLYLRNSKQLLDEEGEWYFDKAQKKLYYIPYQEEDINECEIFASGAVDTLIRMANGAKYIEFEGLTFAHTGWEAADKNGELRWLGHDMILPQRYSYNPNNESIHAIPVPGVLQTSYATGINVRDCVFKHTGGVGIAFQSRMTNCNIEGNVFYDIADSAMYLGHYNSTGLYDKNNNYTAIPNNINIVNNVITGTGRKYSSPALTIYGTTNVNVLHNDISDCPYTGIFIGAAVWNNNLSGVGENHEKEGFANNNNVSYNKIHEIGKLNVDGAGIYMVSHNHGTVISNNYIKNQYMDYGALYNDDGAACYTMTNNVLENVPGWIYHWTDTIRFINAYDNYSTTDEVYVELSASKDTVEPVNVFSADNKPEEVKRIIADAGLEDEYADKIGKYVPDEPKGQSVAFESDMNTVAGTGKRVLLNAGFQANDSGRYRWNAVGLNKSKVNFISYLTSYWKKGMQFDKIYAVFSTPGTYEVVCEADDGRGYVYVNRQNVVVK